MCNWGTTILMKRNEKIVKLLLDILVEPIQANMTVHSVFSQCHAGNSSHGRGHSGGEYADTQTNTNTNTNMPCKQ